MQNNLIILEFANLDDREVLLRASDLQEISQVLQDLFNLALPIASQAIGGPQWRGTQAEIFIAAVAPGSIRVGFRAVCKGLRSIDRDDITAAAAGVVIVDTVMKWVFNVGMALTLFHPVNPVEPERTSVTIEIPEELTSGNFANSVEELVSSALSAGADQVHILAPEQPRCLMSRSKFSPELLGSKAPGLRAGFEGPVRGELTILQPMMPFEREGRIQNMGLGRLLIEGGGTKTPRSGQTFVVLVDWNSSHDYRQPGSPPFSIEGDLKALHGAGYKAMGELTADHRIVSGVLNVTGVETITFD